MTLEGPQLDACDQCGTVDELRLSGGMMLCRECRAIRCPRCGQFTGVWHEEWALFDCADCEDSYVWRDSG